MGFRLLLCVKSQNLNGCFCLFSFSFFLFGFQFNICGAMSVCVTDKEKPAFGCEAGTQTELENLKPERPVGMEKSLQLSTEGFLTLTYKGSSSSSDKGELICVLPSLPLTMLVSLS